MAKTTYYKLNELASVFYDPKNKLKITNGIPGKTDDRTKHTKDALRGGHIIEISLTEYNTMMTALPDATRKAVEAELPKPKKVEVKVKEEEKDEDEDEDEDEEKDEDEDEEKPKKSRRKKRN